MSEISNRLKQARISACYATAREAADRLGVSYHTYVQHENGIRVPRIKSIEKYAKVFHVDPLWLLYNRTSSTKESYAAYPVVGIVHAGSGTIIRDNAQGPFDYVPGPSDALPQTVAVKVSGDSMGHWLADSLLFYHDIKRPVSVDCYGKLCVVGTPDGKVMVKELRPSRQRGLFHLFSANMDPILDQDVEWAARVTNIVWK